jgi:GNAT superfamily N-acetyltransferase
MATGLELIREENPALALIPDDELIERLLEQYQGDLDPDTYIESLLNEMPVESPVVAPTQGAVTGKRPYAMAGSDPDDIGYGEAFASGLKSMWQRTWGPNITYLRGGIAGLMGNEEKAAQLYQQAREQDQAILSNSPYLSFEQATKGPDAGVDTFVKWGLQQAGMSLPYTLMGGVGGLAGRAALKGVIGRTAGTMTGATATFIPQTAAFNIARQQEEVERGNLDEVNEARAFATALPQSILESALYPVLGKLFGPLGRTQFSNVLNRATLGRVAKGSAIGAATEAITEVGQQALERQQAGLSLDSEDAIREYKEAAAGAAFVGGLFGGVTTTAGEAVRAVQPKTKIEEPKVQEGIQQKPEATVLPDEQKTQSVNLAKEEEAKPVTFTVEQQGEKFALNRQDETGNKVAVGTFNTQQEATTKQQEIENQKSKLSQQTFFTKDEIIKENPTIGNIINELEEQGNTIAPHVKQVYFQKNLALPKGDFTNVQASGGTTNSVVDGWYDRTSDLGYIGLSDLSKASETVAHENFHALQRQINRGYQTGLFKQDEQAALDTFLPGGTIDSIAPSVQKGLGKDVMNRLRERHADRTITNREMQAYAFGAYSSMKGQGKRIAAPNPVIRAFQRLFDLVKKAGNVFRKNKVNSVQDLFEKARTGEIGKRAVPKEGVEQLRPKAIAAAEKAGAKGEAPVSTEYSITTPITDKAGKTFSTILPTISPIGEFVAKQSYQRGLGGARLQKIIEPYAKNAVSKSDVDGSVYSKALTDIQSNETELNQNKEYISIRDAEGNSTTLGDTSGRLVNKDYGQPELERLGNAYGTLLKVQAPTVQYALSTVKFRKKPSKKLKKVEEVGTFFDKLVDKTDPLDDKAFNKALDAAEKEINYQIESQEDDGRGWYDEDIQKKFRLLNKKITVKNQYDKDLFTIITGVTSPQTTPIENIEKAGRVYSYYKKFGALPLKKPDNKLFWGRGTISKQLALLQYLIDTRGEKGAVRFLNGMHTKAEMAKVMRDSGKENYGGVFNLNYSKNAEPADMLVGEKGTKYLGAYMFGNKVGSYFLNISGVSDKEGKVVTKDLWATRAFYRQFGLLTDKTQKDKVRGDFLPQHIKRGDEFYNKLGERTGLSAKDAQAVHWFYEHNLYKDLGIRTVPAMYLSQGAEKYINNFDKGKNYGTIDLENRQPSIESTARLRRQKDEERGKETELSVSQTEEIQRQIDDGEVPQFSLSASEKTFERILGFPPIMKKGNQMFTNEILAKANNFEELNKLGKYSVRKHPLKPGYTFFLLPSNAIEPEKGLQQFDTIFKNGNYVEIELNVFEKDAALDLSAISVPKEGRGQGYASEALNEIIKIADEEGAVIEGVIDPFGRKGLSKKKLADWYKRAGFEVDGENISRKPLAVSENLEDVIPTEFSVSGKKLNADNVNLVINKDISSEFTINKTFDEQVGTIQLLQRDAKEKLKPIEGEGDGTGRFLIGIEYDGEGVGYVMGGVTESNTAYIHMAQLFDEDNYASPSLWKKVAKELKNRFGVTKFSGLRITGTRNTDNFVGKTIFVSRDTEQFNVSEYNESDAVEYSVSDKLLSDKEIQDSQLPSNVKAKLFLNRDIKKGTPVSVRPNLNGRVIKGEDKLFVQTIHPGNDLNKALAYDGAVTLTNPELYVSQRARANIASKKQNKFPMAAGRGLYSTEEPSLEGQVLNFNPMTGHLFVDSSGYAVKSIKGDATFFNTKVYTTGELEYYTPENAPKPLDGIDTQVLFKPDENIEMDNISQEKLVQYGLEFSASEKKYSSATESVLSRINPAKQRRTIAGHWKAYSDNNSWSRIGTRAHQYWVDQYSSVKKYIGDEPYKMLTMTHASSGALEGALNYGIPFLDKDGGIDLKESSLGKGLFTRFEKLGKDLPDFLAWVAANRASYLISEGKETGLGDIKDINTAIRELSKGKEKQFNESLRDLNEFRDAFLQIGLQSGYLSREAYNTWTSDAGYNFYIPFYRILEDPDSSSGPRSAESVVNQPEIQRYRGADLPVQDLLSNIIQNFNFLAEASLKNQAGLKTLEQGVSMGATTKINAPTKTSVFARKNGKMVHYEVNEPLVMQSLQALNWNGWQNPAMGALRNFKRFLTIGVTASPAFRIRNLIRDSIHAIAVGKLKYNPLENVFTGLKGFGLQSKSETRARMAFGGGEIHFGHIYGGDPNATQMLIDRNIDLNTVMKSDGWGKGSRRFFKSSLGKSLNWWQEVGNTAENANRAALYQQLRKKGVSHFEASYQARDLLNFSRHGAGPFARFLTQSVAFLNARIQGLDKLGRAMSKEQRAQLLTVLGAYSLASMGLYLAYRDDEDYKAREEWDKDTYHWFKLPNSDTAFRIPRPFEVGAVGVIFERMLEQIVDDDVHGSLFLERMGHVLHETFAFDVRPQLVTPAIEVYANKDSFTQRPIEPLWMKRLPASERKYAYTSQAYVNTSKILEAISFKQIQFSPVQMEHLVQGYFGWVGSTVASAVSISDYPRNVASLFQPNSPLFMGFKVDLPSLQTKYKTEFYTQIQEMNEVMALMRLYQRRGENDKALQLFNKNKNLLAWKSTYDKINRQIQSINRQIRLIESQDLSETEKMNKVRQLNLLKNELVRSLKERVLDYEKTNDTRVKRPLWWN